MTDETVVDFAGEKQKRIHEVHEKRLQEVRLAFTQALPLTKGKKRKPKKR